MSDKPIKTKPMFYAAILPRMQEIAKNNGYNLLVHGSLSRDLDLVAVPWVDNPAPEVFLIQQLHQYLADTHFTAETEKQIARAYMHTILPGGRSSYVINLLRNGNIQGGYHDAQYYLDISITPLVLQTNEAP